MSGVKQKNLAASLAIIVLEALFLLGNYSVEGVVILVLLAVYLLVQNVFTVKEEGTYGISDFLGGYIGAGLTGLLLMGLTGSQVYRMVEAQVEIVGFIILGLLALVFWMFTGWLRKGNVILRFLAFAVTYVGYLLVLLSMGLQILIKSPIMAVWAVIKIIRKSWTLSAITAGFILALLVMMLVILGLVIPRFRRVQKLVDHINLLARENLTGINVVHAYNAEDYQNAKFLKSNEALMRTQLFNQRSFAFLMPAVTLAMNALSLVIYWVGAAIVNDVPAADTAARLATFGNIVVFGTYATYVIMSIMMMVMIIMFLPAAQVSAQRISEVLDTRVDLEQGDRSDSPETGTVEFKDVSFHYPASDKDVLEHISFTAKKGETVAFIGATGSGKTTLVSLAARFYDATAGQVLVDGVDVKDYTFDALYDRVGYVTQKAVLFSGDIRGNVLFGKSRGGGSDGNVREALDLAQASEFVEKLPGGPRAPIAQGGANVSGGQKQRLSIARALARKPEILVFDDSFSALDYRTDAKLRAGLERELKDTTRLIVAQRIGTIRDADRIIVLDEGKMVGMGTHDQLMKTCPVYREIAQSQLSRQELGA